MRKSRCYKENSLPLLVKLFKINNEKWFISIVPPESEQLKLANGGYTIGVCDDDLKTIFIASGLPLKLLKKVISHEIVHAAMFSYNIELDLDEEELLADLVATYGEGMLTTAEEIFKKIKGAY